MDNVRRHVEDDPVMGVLPRLVDNIRSSLAGWDTAVAILTHKTLRQQSEADLADTGHPGPWEDQVPCRRRSAVVLRGHGFSSYKRECASRIPYTDPF